MDGISRAVQELVTACESSMGSTMRWLTSKRRNYYFSRPGYNVVAVLLFLYGIFKLPACVQSVRGAWYSSSSVAGTPLLTRDLYLASIGSSNPPDAELVNTLLESAALLHFTHGQITQVW